MSHPAVTVVLPVFNAQKFIQASIHSVLKQSLQNFELLIIDDCSTDNTVEVIENFDDPKIRIKKNDKNLGVAEALNLGIQLSAGKYIARMDADDLCYPKRLEKQYQFMEKNPRIGISGTWIKYFGKQLPVIERSPSGPDVIKAFMLFDNPLFHPSVIIRKECLEKHNLRYDPHYNRSEDFELWLRASECFDLDNIEEPLLKFRCHEESVTFMASEVMKNQACELLNRGLKKLKLPVSDESLLFHYKVSKGQPMQSAQDLWLAKAWLTKLILTNDNQHIYQGEALRKAAAMIWFRLCLNSAHLGLVAWKMSEDGLRDSLFAPPLQNRVRFLLSIFLNKYLRRK